MAVCSPAYSDEIVQDLHLLPFYPLSCAYAYSGTVRSLIDLFLPGRPDILSLLYADSA